MLLMCNICHVRSQKRTDFDSWSLLSYDDGLCAAESKNGETIVPLEWGCNGVTYFGMNSFLVSKEINGAVVYGVLNFQEGAEPEFVVPLVCDSVLYMHGLCFGLRVTSDDGAIWGLIRHGDEASGAILLVPIEWQCDSILYLEDGCYALQRRFDGEDRWGLISETYGFTGFRYADMGVGVDASVKKLSRSEAKAHVRELTSQIKAHPTARLYVERGMTECYMSPQQGIKDCKKALNMSDCTLLEAVSAISAIRSCEFSANLKKETRAAAWKSVLHSAPRILLQSSGTFANIFSNQSSSNASLTSQSSGRISQGNSHNNTSNNRISSKVCTICRGSGKCMGYNGKYKCFGTGKCKECGGKKYTYASNGEIRNCDICHNTGKCPSCGGNGNCKSCNGKGKR